MVYDWDGRKPGGQFKGSKINKEKNIAQKKLLTNRLIFLLSIFSVIAINLLKNKSFFANIPHFAYVALILIIAVTSAFYILCVGQIHSIHQDSSRKPHTEEKKDEMRRQRTSSGRPTEAIKIRKTTIDNSLNVVGKKKKDEVIHLGPK